MKPIAVWLPAVALITVLVGPVGAIAAESVQGDYATIGAGAVSCGRWTAERKSHGAAVPIFTSWVLGYVSAVNMWGPSQTIITRGTDSDGILGLVDKYCGDHPLDNVGTAIAVLVPDLILHATLSGH